MSILLLSLASSPVIFTAAAETPPPPGHAGQEDTAAQGPSLEYLDIVDLYRRRRYDEALQHVRKLNPQRVMDMLARWEDVTAPMVDERTVGVEVRGLMNGFHPGDERLQAAAVMHTDYAMRLVGELKFISAGLQLDIAQRFIERIRNATRRERFRHDWLLVMGNFYQTTEFNLGVDGFEYAKTYYDQAVRRFPDDAEILLCAGTLYEHGGTLKNGDRRLLKKAQDLYRLALLAQPDLAEARLRYGRVLEKRGEYDKAKAELEAALASMASPVARGSPREERGRKVSPTHTGVVNERGGGPSERDESRFLSYVALLVLGRISEREGDLETAVARYTYAVELIPHWQVAYVALSHALHISGRTKESAEILVKTMEAPRPSAEDFNGWMVYEVGRTNRVPVLWDRMREGVSF